MAGTKDAINPARFKKGQSGNPAGSSKRQREIKGFARMTHLEVVELGTLLLRGDLQQLAAIRDEKGASVNKIWLASLIVKSIQNQDVKIWTAVLDRIIGKPKERVEVTGDDGGPVRTENVTDEQLRAELAVIRARAKAREK